MTSELDGISAMPPPRQNGQNFCHSGPRKGCLPGAQRKQGLCGGKKLRSGNDLSLPFLSFRNPTKAYKILMLGHKS